MKKTPYDARYKKKLNKLNFCVYVCNSYTVDHYAIFKGKIAVKSWKKTLIRYESKNHWMIHHGFKIVVYRDLIFKKSKFYPKDLSVQESEPVKILSIGYIDIS